MLPTGKHRLLASHRHLTNNRKDPFCRVQMLGPWDGRPSGEGRP